MMFDDEEYFEISVMESLRIITWSAAIAFVMALSTMLLLC